MLCVNQDHSLSADAVPPDLVFLEMSESLDWSAMTCSSFAGIYFGFCLTVFRSVCDCYKFLSKTAVSELYLSTSVATLVKSYEQRAKQGVRIVVARIENTNLPLAAEK